MMAKALADAGASKVYIVGRRKEVLDKAADTIGKPEVVVPLVGDVTDKASLQSIASHVGSDVGYLNLLVANAGIGGPQGGAPSPDMSLDEWVANQLQFEFADFTQTFNVNATSVWFTAMAFLKLLDAGNKKGNVKMSSQVVVTSSIAAYNKKAPGGYAYGQSKSAATMIAKQLSIVLPQWGMRANCLCPGRMFISPFSLSKDTLRRAQLTKAGTVFPSEMSAPIVERSGTKITDMSVEIPVDKAIVPMGRMGTAEEMAGQILYLASPAGGYLNGNIIVVDGGRLTTMPSTGY